MISRKNQIQVLKVPLTTLIKLPEEHVKVPAKKTVTAKMTVEIPANGFQGLVLGGVYASLAEDEKEEKGKSTGLAVTCRLWDATPADFCCHNKDRDAEEDVVTGYVDCKVDYVFGGGAQYFENRKDGRNLFEELRTKGFQTPRTWDELAAIGSGKVFAVPYPKDTPLPAERGDLLARASLKGIELLNQNKKGSS